MNYLEVYFNGVLKQSIPIKTDVLSIGRASNNDIVIDNMGVSSHHAVISKKEGFFFLDDINSTNGTFLNAKKITSRQRINQQDSIVIGKHTLMFSEWSQSQGSSSTVSYQESDDATIMVNQNKLPINKQNPQRNTEELFYLFVKGEKNGINKLLLTENSYSIGKAKDNKIRIGGWFTPAYIAEIEKVGHSFFITPFIKNKVILNDVKIDSTSQLNVSDEIKIKSLSLQFSNG